MSTQPVTVTNIATTSKNIVTIIKHCYNYKTLLQL